MLKLKFAKINKRGGPNKNGGSEKFSKINKRGGLLLGTLEYLNRSHNRGSYRFAGRFGVPQRTVVKISRHL